jgi:ribonucleoside-diphosphate reductase beta chain
MLEQEKKEKILTDTGVTRFTYYPIEHHDIHKFYKKHFSTIWSEDMPLYNNDLSDWENKLNDNERYFIKNILAFFAASDGIVNENLAENFLREVMYPEAKAFYGMQIMMENVHSITYSMLIETLIRNVDERQKCFQAIDNFPAVAKKAKWALNWISSDSFVDRLLAFVAVEGIFFSGSFASIFYLKSRGLMLDGLAKANEYIFKDENLHCEFAIHLLQNHIEFNKPSEERIKEILLDALEIEKEFITESLPVSLIGMSSDSMKKYLEFITDGLLVQLGCSKHFNTKNPFPFIEGIALEHKQNMHEGRPADYQKAKNLNNIDIVEDF